MRWDISDWDRLLHRALFVSIGTILYSAPASAIALDRFLGDQLQDEPIGFDVSEWLPFILVVWLAAIPLIKSVRRWDENPEASAVWLGIFLFVAVLPMIVGFLSVYRAASALVILPALAFPIQWMDLPFSGSRVGPIIAEVVTFTLFFAVPLGGIIIHVLKIRGVQYESL